MQIRATPSAFWLGLPEDWPSSRDSGKTRTSSPAQENSFNFPSTIRREFGMMGHIQMPAIKPADVILSA